jgi:hypothetical protein
MAQTFRTIPNREEMLQALQLADPNGCYTDSVCDADNMARLTESEACHYYSRLIVARQTGDAI